jgi:DMSO/TMAO reductase YedYZ molybdopterin-dependent catalytic subunit
MKTLLFGLAFFVLVGLIFVACFGDSNKKAVTPLPPAEIRQYEGQALTSVKDYPETSIAGSQKVSLDSYRLKISGLVGHPLELTYEQALARKHYTKVVTLHCVEGWDATILWEGALLEDLLAEAGAKRDAVVVIFHSADGYTSSLPLEYVRAKNILLAYKINGLTLSAGQGFPFQVVAESKWGYKWVKWVTEIEISADVNYRGYWESRGYSNNGDQAGPMME